MRILLVGATGTIGRAVARALAAHHDVVPVARSSGAVRVDIDQPESIEVMYRSVGMVDAVVCAAGNAVFAPLAQLTDEAFRTGLISKLMGQVNLVRRGFPHLRDGGSFTLTSGVLAHRPSKGSASVSLVNAAVEGFAGAAALEAPRGIRVNVVSPPWISETLTALGMDPATGLPADVVARAYVASVEGSANGAVLTP